MTVLDEHTSGALLYTPSSWYTPGKFWYTLGCTIHSVDKHWSNALSLLLQNKRTPAATQKKTNQTHTKREKFKCKITGICTRGKIKFAVKRGPRANLECEASTSFT